MCNIRLYKKQQNHCWEQLKLKIDHICEGRTRPRCLKQSSCLHLEKSILLQRVSLPPQEALASAEPCPVWSSGAIALLRGVGGMLSALGRSEAKLYAGCRSRLCSPFSFIYVLKWLTSILNRHPKKPLNSYIQFAKDDIIKAQSPDRKITEVMKRFAEQWKEHPDAVKKAYEDPYKVELKAYQEVKRIREALTPARRASLAEYKTQKRLKSKEIAGHGGAHL